MSNQTTNSIYPKIIIPIYITPNNFKKYSILVNQIMKEVTQFLKDYCTTMLYNKILNFSISM